MDLNSICLVLDMDGFRVGQNKKFYPRELGYADLATPRRDYGSFRFDLRPIRKLLVLPQDNKAINFCTKRLHGLTFEPDHREIRAGVLFHLDHLEILVKNLWSEYKRPGRDVIAYKGGDVEKNLLRHLGIPSLNLEDFGCPKYDDLPHPPESRDCGYHWPVQNTRGGVIHCPKKECKVFADWVIQQKLQQQKN